MISQISKSAVLIALGVAVGFLLAPLPNVEAISAVSFLSGCLLGLKGGVLVGGVSILLFSILNPMGPAPFPVLAAQTLGMALIGCSGYVWRNITVRTGMGGALAVGIGVLLTACYDLLTSYGAAVSVGRWRNPLPILISGLPFSLVHVIANGMIFGTVGALLVRKYKLRGKRTNGEASFGCESDCRKYSGW